MSANECMILDDEELEKTQVKPEEKLNPRDMRAWLPETLQHTNPFQSNYVSTSHAFPKVFQKKEDFPKLSERVVPIPQTTMNYRSRLLHKPEQIEKISTINVLERVREVLQETKAEPRQVQDNPPCYSPHTPPYPYSPIEFTNSPPVNEIVYPIGTPVYPTAMTPSSPP